MRMFLIVCFFALVSAHAAGQARVESVLCRESVVGEIPIDGRARSVLRDGSLLYVLTGESLSVYDASVPEWPTLLSRYALEGTGQAMSLDGGLLYVVCSSNVTIEISVFEVDADAQLNERAQYEVEWFGSPAVRFLGSTVLLGDMWYGLRAVSFADMQHPTESFTPTVNKGVGPIVVEVLGNDVIYGPNENLRLFSLNDLGVIQFVSDFDLFLDPWRTAVSGDLLYKLGDDEGTLDSGLLVYDTSSPQAPVLLASMPIDGDALELVADGAMVLVKGFGTVEVIDVSDLSDLRWVGSYSGDLNYFASAADDEHVYLTVTNSMQVIDRALLSVNEITGIETLGRAWRVEAMGEYAYVLSRYGGVPNSNGIQVIDISDPSKPVLTGTAMTPGPSVDFEIHWPLIYTADSFTGLSIFDVSDPAAPVRLSSTSLNGDYAGYSSDVTLWGEIAYVANAHRLVVLDVSDLTSPIVLREIELEAQSVYADDGVLFVTTRDDELLAFGLDDPEMPVLLAGVTHEYLGQGSPIESAYEFGRVGDRLFVSTGGALLEFDLSLPQSISFVQEHELRTREPSIFIDDGLMYTSSTDSGRLSELNDDGSISYLASFAAPYRARDIAVNGSYVLVAGGGLRVIDISASCGDCVADFNGDGMLDFFDVSAFIVAYTQGDLAADLNGDGVLDFFDVALLTGGFAGGCA